jgi:hypothetical protein
MPTAWWFRPVSSAARVGEHIAVTWKPVVPQPLRGHPVVVRGADRTAEGAGIAEPGVIDQHEQDVRRAHWWLDMADQPPVRPGTAERLVRDATERRTADGQHGPVGLVSHLNLSVDR